MRPICPVCNQKPLAINYIKNEEKHYRSKCMNCAKSKRKIKIAKPRWQLAGYKKKPVCDRCGFKSRYSSQILVVHVDGDCNHNNLRNLKSICLNCWDAAKKEDQPWKVSDLQEDV